MLHDSVVSVGIDLQISTLLICPFQAEAGGASDRAVRSDPMDRTVGVFVEPLSAVNMCVCAVVSFFVIEGGDDLTMFDADIAASCADIFGDQLPGRIGGAMNLRAFSYICNNSSSSSGVVFLISIRFLSKMKLLCFIHCKRCNETAVIHPSVRIYYTCQRGMIQGQVLPRKV